jgi:hypothetical protein
MFAAARDAHLERRGGDVSSIHAGGHWLVTGDSRSCGSPRRRARRAPRGLAIRAASSTRRRRPEILTLRGPMVVKQLAVYQPAQPGTGTPWSRVSVWDAGTPGRRQRVRVRRQWHRHRGPPGRGRHRVPGQRLDQLCVRVRPGELAVRPAARRRQDRAPRLVGLEAVRDAGDDAARRRRRVRVLARRDRQVARAGESVADPGCARGLVPALAASVEAATVDSIRGLRLPR